MKKFTSVILAALMIVSCAIVAFAANNHTVTFTDMTYATAYREDQPGREGYVLGKDYWFQYTDADGKVVDVKKDGTTVSIPDGQAFACSVVLAEYIEPTSLRVMAYPTGLAVSTLYEPVYGNPKGEYNVNKSSNNTYGIIVKSDMTISVSEYHMYNDGFLFAFPSNKYFKITRLNDTGKGDIGDKGYEAVYGSKIVYHHQDLYFMVTVPSAEEDPKHTYNYETYTVGFTRKEGSETLESRNLTPIWTSADGLSKIYVIEDCYNTISISVNGVVEFTFDMIKETFEDISNSDFDIEDISSLNFGALDFSAIMDWFNKIIKLIIDILKGFGLNIG